MGILDAPVTPASIGAAKAIPDGIDALRGPALLPFWSALANRANAPVDILTIGHSFVEGVHSTSVNQTLPSLLRDGLRARFQPSGVAGGFGYHSTPYVSYFTDDPIVNSGGVLSAASVGLGRKSWYATSAGQTRTLTFTGTGVDIFYAKYSGGAIGYYTVDGGTQNTFTTDSGGAVVDGQRIQVRGLTAGPHAIVVGYSSGAGQVFSTGFMIYNGDESKGIRVWNGSKSSQQSSYFVDSGNPAWVQNVAVIQPALVVITMMCNDFGGDTPLPVIPSATTKTNLQTLIANIRAQCTTAPSFVICTEFQRDTTSGPAPTEPWSNYVNAARAIAAADPGVLTWDMGARFGYGPFSSGNTLVNSDKIHPTNAGFQLWADGLSEFVCPR